MSVALNESGLIRLLESPEGRVGLDLARRVDNVVQKATDNASGRIIQVRSGRLRAGIRGRVEKRAGRLIGVVSDDARSTWHGEPFAYPRHLEAQGFHWLSDALREGFR